MNTISLESGKAEQFLAAGAIEALLPQVEAANRALEDGTCAGNDFLGWMHCQISGYLRG